MPKKFPKRIIKCKKPKMSDYGGRTWDSLTIIMPDGIEGTGYCDVTWGEYFY